MTNNRKFKPEETFQLEMPCPETGALLEARCMVVGYDLWDDKATTVMVNIVMPTGYVLKKLIGEEELEQMKLHASKLYKSLK